MNIGLYSFQNPELIETSKLIKELKNMFIIDNIYMYSENTNKERIEYRDGLKRLIEDYRNKKIDIIAFKDLNSLGSNRYIRGKILQTLLEGNYDFSFINLPYTSLCTSGRVCIELIIKISQEDKIRADKRSEMGRILYNRKIKNK